MMTSWHGNALRITDSFGGNPPCGVLMYHLKIARTNWSTNIWDAGELRHHGGYVTSCDISSWQMQIKPTDKFKGAVFNMMTSSNGSIFRVTGPLCGEFTGPGEFPPQRQVTRSFDVFFDLRLNKRLSKQPWGWWFETPSWSLCRHCNEQQYWFLNTTTWASLP